MTATNYRPADSGIGDYTLTLRWGFENRGTGPVFYYRDCGVQLEKWIDRQWVPAYSRTCSGAWAVDTIPPGVTRSGEFIVLACYRPNCAPRFEVTPIPGTYRMLLGLHASAVTNVTGSTALSDPLSTDSRRSNPFRLDLP